MKKLICLLVLCVSSFAHAGAVPPFTTIFMRTVLDDATALIARTTLGIGEGDSPTFLGLVLSGDTFILATTKTPASASAAGTTGQIAWDADYIYVCTTTNTWERVAIATWGAAPENVIYAAEDVVFAAEQVVYP